MAEVQTIPLMQMAGKRVKFFLIYYKIMNFCVNCVTSVSYEWFYLRGGNVIPSKSSVDVYTHQHQSDTISVLHSPSY